MLGVGGGRIQDRDLESRASVICEFEPLSLKPQLKERLRGQSPASSDYRDCTHSDLSSVPPSHVRFLTLERF